VTELNQPEKKFDITQHYAPSVLKSYSNTICSQLEFDNLFLVGFLNHTTLLCQFKTLFHRGTYY